MKESSDHIDHDRSKSQTNPSMISISHAVHNKLVRLSTWFSFNRTNNQCFTYITKCEKHIMWKVYIHTLTWLWNSSTCSCDVVSWKSEVSCFPAMIRWTRRWKCPLPRVSLTACNNWKQCFCSLYNAVFNVFKNGVPMGLTHDINGWHRSPCRTQRYTINFEMQLKPLIVGVNLKFSSICMVVCCLRAKHSLHKRKLL